MRKGVAVHRVSPSVGKLQGIAVAVLWLVVAVLVTLLALRFGMRAVGVRDDIPFPGFVYSLTAPLVAPFYRFFPASERFDAPAVEAAALVAAGTALALGLGVYVVGLLLGQVGERQDLD